MRVLIYDNNPDDLEYFCGLLKQLPLDILIDKISDYKDGIYLYEKYIYNILFIDFKDDIGKKLLSDILKINSEQRIITINDLADCSKDLGCIYCQTNYDKCKIIKPINMEDIQNIFLNKNVCNPSLCNNDLFFNLTIIDKEYSTYNLNLNELRFYKNKNLHSQNTSDTVNLTSKLTSLNIDFIMENDYIQIIR